MVRTSHFQGSNPPLEEDGDCARGFRNIKLTFPQTPNPTSSPSQLLIFSHYPRCFRLSMISPVRMQSLIKLLEAFGGFWFVDRVQNLFRFSYAANSSLCVLGPIQFITSGRLNLIIAISFCWVNSISWYFIVNRILIVTKDLLFTHRFEK